MDCPISEDYLANKYRVSWQQATDVQRQAICDRFGVHYTHGRDEALLKIIAVKQQTLYIQSKIDRQERLVRTAEALIR
jgi:hypothetical protein